MDSDCAANPDFCSWSKVYIPYCSGDMHSGTRTDRSVKLGNYFFAGHLQIEGMASEIKSHPARGAAPTHFLITGSSAGGIGALTHTDFIAEKFPKTVVKGAPQVMNIVLKMMNCVLK